MKILLDGLNGRYKMTKEKKITELEDRATEMMQSKGKWGKNEVSETCRTLVIMQSNK